MEPKSDSLPMPLSRGIVRILKGSCSARGETLSLDIQCLVNKTALVYCRYSLVAKSNQTQRALIDIV